jgi:hypothetical protein
MVMAGKNGWKEWSVVIPSIFENFNKHPKIVMPAESPSHEYVTENQLLNPC